MAIRRSDGLAYAAALVLLRLSAFLFLPAITAALTVGEMGLLASSWVFIDLFQILASLGLMASLGRFFPLAQDPEGRGATLSAALGGIVAGGGGFVLAALAFRASPLADRMLPFLRGLDGRAFAALLTAAVLGNLVSSLFVYLRAERKAMTFLGISAAGAALEALLLAAVLAGQRFSLPVLLGVEAAKQAFLALCLAVAARRDLSVFPSWRELSRQLAFGLWFIPIGLGEWFITGSDRFWLGKLGSLPDVGVYGFTYRFVMPLSVLFAGGLMNAHARLYRFEGSAGEPLARELLSAFLKRAGVLTIAAAAFLPAALWVAARRFHLFPEAYLKGLPAAPMMAAVVFALYWSRYYAAVMEYRLRARVLMFAEAGIGLLSAALIPAAILCARSLEVSLLCGAALGALAAKGIGIVVLARLARLGGGWRSSLVGLATLAACLAAAAAWSACIR
jgi:hypothetical protein